MRRGLAIAALLGVVVGAGLAVALSSGEIRNELLLRVSPELFRQEVFLEFENSRHERVYMLGTIHDRHLTTREYSLAHVQSVVLRLRPDLLLVESRPGELARDNWADGPIEMAVASLTARSAGIAVSGIDWWKMDSSHQIDNDKRDRRMFANVLAVLPGRRSVLILTGFSHLDAFQQDLTSNGYAQTPFSSAEKDALFTPVGTRFLFPHGMTHYLQRRISLDRAEMRRETDPFWKDRMADAVNSRLMLLKIVRADGEKSS